MQGMQAIRTAPQGQPLTLQDLSFGVKHKTCQCRRQ
jgi:hypothetical protein